MSLPLRSKVDLVSQARGLGVSALLLSLALLLATALASSDDTGEDADGADGGLDVALCEAGVYLQLFASKMNEDTWGHGKSTCRSVACNNNPLAPASAVPGDCRRDGHRARLSCRVF